MKFTLSLWKKYSYLILIIFIVVGLLDLRIGLIASVCMIGPMEVTTDQFMAYDKENAIVLDVRTEKEFNNGHIEGAINLYPCKV